MNHNTKESRFNAAVQAGRAKEWAQTKANRRFKKSKSEKKPYKPGVTVLGLSAVSEAISKKFGGAFPSRRTRREYCKAYSTPFTAHYNGEAPVRVPHVVNPHRLSVRWR